MSTYRVFLGAPTHAEINNDPITYSWRTLSSKSISISKPLASLNPSRGLAKLQQTQSFSVVPLPLATLEEASRRISLIYKDMVFNEGPEEESFAPEVADTDFGGAVDPSWEIPVFRALQSTILENMNTNPALGRDLTTEVSVFRTLPSTNLQSNMNTNPGQGEDPAVEVSVFRGVEQTTMFSWPPSRPAEDDIDDSRDSFAGPSFLLDNSSSSSSSLTSSALQANPGPPQTSPPETKASGQSQSRFLETQDPETQSFGNYSDASSIARFPSFHFNLHFLTSLTALAEKKFKGSLKVNCLLAVLEVEGPDSIHIKKGADAGKEVSIFKMVLGDEEGTVCKLTAWREVAEDWGGAGKAVATKRGDIVHIENVMATCDPATSITLSASPYLKSQLVICYRTMPYSHEDGRLRPDLRLGFSEPSVRKVAAVVQWFEDMAGLQQH